jgi:hypothetical protein
VIFFRFLLNIGNEMGFRVFAASVLRAFTVGSANI